MFKKLLVTAPISGRGQNS